MTEGIGKTRVGRRFALYAALGVPAAGLCVVLAGLWLGSGGFWNGNVNGPAVWKAAPRVLHSGQFRLFLVTAAGSLLGISLLAGAMLRAGRNRRHAAQDGTAIIEFALALPILLMLTLLMIQSSLLMGGYLCVNYAGYCAARSAVVFVPRQMGDEDRNVVADLSDPDISQKLWRIRPAAVWATMPISDGGYNGRGEHTAQMEEALESFFESFQRPAPGWIRGYLGKKLAYAEHNTRVSLTPPADGASYGEHEDIRVSVRHNLYLSVPYAGWLMTKLDSDHAVEFGDGRYALEVEIPCTLSNEGVIDIIEAQ